MSERNFFDLLKAKWAEKKFVCVGLDPDYSKMPQSAKGDNPTEDIYYFCLDIVNATKEYACAYKPNIAFFERYGQDGILFLEDIFREIKKIAPDVPIILDAKRGDIGNTNSHYAHFAFENLKADAITISPYLGKEAMQPFLDYKNKGIFVLCKTSNSGGGEFQDLDVVLSTNKTSGTAYLKKLYEVVAMNVLKDWNENENCGLVVGATYPKQLQEIRWIAPNLPLLIPGVGTQGGDLEKVVNTAFDRNLEGFIINSSSAILYASNGEDYAEAAGEATKKLHRQIVTIVLEELAVK